MIDWGPIGLTLKLAFVTTVFLLVGGVPFAYWLSSTRNPLRYIFEAIINLPLVLPPTVIGFYLLLLFSPYSGIGQFVEHYFSFRLAFSFPGLVIGSIIFSLPFMVNPVKSAFDQLGRGLTEQALVLGKSQAEIFWHVLLPNIKPSLITAAVMTAAHTVGEFGVALMIGGNIPKVTKVVSIAIFERVEMMDYPSAHMYSALLLAGSFVVLLILSLLNKKNVPSSHD